MAGRISITALLMLWIFHAIFMEQGKLLAASGGWRWEELSRWEQWRLAWSVGPGALYDILTQTRWAYFLPSLLCVGATVTLGAWRWHLLLRAQGIAVTFGKTFQISMIGQFFNGFLLGSTGGDVLKAYTVHARPKKAKPKRSRPSSWTGFWGFSPCSFLPFSSCSPIIICSWSISG